MGIALPTLGTQLDIVDKAIKDAAMNELIKILDIPPCHKTGELDLPNLPHGAQTCSAGFSFYAPSGYNFKGIVEAGKAGGMFNLKSTARAIGFCGAYDYQRMVVSPGEFTYIEAYTPVSNIDVGTYMEGAGWSRDYTHLIANVLFAHLVGSKNAGPITGAFSTSYNTYLGWDLAAGGVNPTCH